MHVKIIYGDSTDKAREACYRYLAEKYRREVIRRGRTLWPGEHGGTSEKRVLDKVSDSRREEKSRD